MSTGTVLLINPNDMQLNKLKLTSINRGVFATINIR